MVQDYRNSIVPWPSTQEGMRGNRMPTVTENFKDKRNFPEKSSTGISAKEPYIVISFCIRDGEYA